MKTTTLSDPAVSQNVQTLRDPGQLLGGGEYPTFLKSLLRHWVIPHSHSPRLLAIQAMYYIEAFGTWRPRASILRLLEKHSHTILLRHLMPSGVRRGTAQAWLSYMCLSKIVLSKGGSSPMHLLGHPRHRKCSMQAKPTQSGELLLLQCSRRLGKKDETKSKTSLGLHVSKEARSHLHGEPYGFRD